MGMCDLGPLHGRGRSRTDPRAPPTSYLLPRIPSSPHLFICIETAQKVLLFVLRRSKKCFLIVSNGARVDRVCHDLYGVYGLPEEHAAVHAWSSSPWKRLSTSPAGIVGRLLLLVHSAISSSRSFLTDAPCADESPLVHYVQTILLCSQTFNWFAVQ